MRAMPRRRRGITIAITEATCGVGALVVPSLTRMMGMPLALAVR